MAWTAPRTWVASEVVTASIANVHIRDNLLALGDAWTTWTPVWTASVTNPTLGNGTLAGRRLSAGKMTQFVTEVTFGSTSAAGSGTYQWTYPVAARATTTPRQGPGQITCYDTSGVVARLGLLDAFSTTTMAAFTFDNVRVGSAAPFTWATGDTIVSNGSMYEAA